MIRNYSKVIYRIIAVSVFLVFGIAAYGSQWKVPEDFETIREAVENASPGDEILVGKGIYQGAVIDREVHIKGKGKNTIITELSSLPFGVNGPKAAFFLPGPEASHTTISNMSFAPFEAESYPGSGVSFPVFCRNVDGVQISHITSTRSVQGVTLTASTNSVVKHSTFSNVTTYFAGGGGIGITLGGEGGGHKIEHNKISLTELFYPEGFSPVGIGVVGAPVGPYTGSQHDVLIRHNKINVIVDAEDEGTQGIEIGTHAAYLPDECPAHTEIVLEQNKICVKDPSIALVYREVDSVKEKKNKICKPEKEKDKKGKRRRGHFE